MTNAIKISLLGAVLCVAFVSGLAYAQAHTAWHDDLVDHMVGIWKMEGPVMGRPAHHDVQAEWVLGHQFLRIHEITSPDAPPAERRYEATWFLGYDPVSERYVLHLMDVFGARFSETLGYGVREGNEIRFVFEYPDGPFHTRYRWMAEKDSWEWEMKQKDKDGKWGSFADLKLTHAAKP